MQMFFSYGIGPDILIVLEDCIILFIWAAYALLAVIIEIPVICLLSYIISNKKMKLSLIKIIASA